LLAHFRAITSILVEVEYDNEECQAVYEFIELTEAEETEDDE